MTRPNRSVATVLAVFLVSQTVILASDNSWQELAEHHVAFAKGLAEEQVRYGPDLESLVSDKVTRCEPIDYKLAGLPPSEVRQVKLFCEELCMPWLKAWATALRPCDQAHVPKWCDDFALAGKHLAFGPYFETLTTALKGSTSALERYNIMAIIADRLTKKVLQDYPQREIDSWVATALASYLADAAADDAILIVKALSFNSFGHESATAREVRAYVDRSTSLTAEQRGELERLAQVIASRVAGT